jgi:hypothetical protein
VEQLGVDKGQDYTRCSDWKVKHLADPCWDAVTRHNVPYTQFGWSHHAPAVSHAPAVGLAVMLWPGPINIPLCVFCCRHILAPSPGDAAICSRAEVGAPESTSTAGVAGVQCSTAQCRPRPWQLYTGYDSGSGQLLLWSCTSDKVLAATLQAYTCSLLQQ